MLIPATGIVLALSASACKSLLLLALLCARFSVFVISGSASRSCCFSSVLPFCSSLVSLACLAVLFADLSKCSTSPPAVTRLTVYRRLNIPGVLRLSPVSAPGLPCRSALSQRSRSRGFSQPCRWHGWLRLDPLLIRNPVSRGWLVVFSRKLRNTGRQP